MKYSTLKSKSFWAAVFTSSAATAFATFMLMDISEKRREAQTPYHIQVQITDESSDPAAWGANFPHHYQMYLQTVDQERTKYGGSEAVPYDPTPDDPRKVVAQ